MWWLLVVLYDRPAGVFMRFFGFADFAWVFAAVFHAFFELSFFCMSFCRAFSCVFWIFHFSHENPRCFFMRLFTFLIFTWNLARFFHAFFHFWRIHMKIALKMSCGIIIFSNKHENRQCSVQIRCSLLRQTPQLTVPEAAGTPFRRQPAGVSIRPAAWPASAGSRACRLPLY